MTIQTENGKAVYIADGATASFVVPFYFFDDELAVYIGDAVEPLAEGYAVTGGGKPEGGEITFAEPPAAESKITIVRNVELTQLIKFIEGENFPASDFEYALDKIVMALQQLKEIFGRALTITPGSDMSRDEALQFLQDMRDNFALIKELPELAGDVLAIYNEWQDAITDTVAANDERMVTAGGVWTYVNGIRAKKYTDLTVATSDIVADSSYETYPYRADIAIVGATAENMPLVVFSPDDATGGNFAPIAEASAGKISIYMKEIPSETSVTIPAVLLQ